MKISIDYKKVLLSLLKSIATIVAIFVNKSSLYELEKLLSFKYLIVLVILFVFYMLINLKNKMSISVDISSAIISLAMLVGELLTKYETCFPKHISLILIVFSFIGWFIFIKTVLTYIKEKLAKISKENAIFKFLIKLDTRKFILICMMIMIICWLPYIVFRYPAGIESDAKNQIAQALGFQPLTNRWPVFSSIIMGTFFKIGRMLFNSYNIGAISFVVFQTIVSAYVLAYTLNFIKKHNGTGLEIIITLLIYSIIPLFPGYITSIVKDTLFTDMVVLFNVLLIEIFIDTYSNSKYITIGIVSLLMCLLRNNGINILLFELIIVFIYMLIKKVNVKYLLITFVVVILINGFYQKLMIPSLGPECDNIVEALSIPLQQTARCLVEHYDEISTDDINTINKVLDVDTILERYDPLLSDPVKETFHGDSGDLLDYFKLWFRMLFKYPSTYIDATLQNIYGFFYPNSKMWNRPNCGFYTTNDIAGEYLLIKNEKLKSLCDLFENSYINVLENLPVVGIIFSCGFYMCVNTALIIWAICNKKLKHLIYYMPSIIGILVCIAGPTFAQNGVRYALPVIYCTPLYIWLYRKEVLKNSDISVL